MELVKLNVEVFNGEDASVNSYVFSNGHSILAMDVLRSTKDAKGLADFIAEKGLPLSTILITHGHPDHYIGMDWLKRKFPKVEIVVPTVEIKDDIIAFSTWMSGVGWLDSEPNLIPKSKEYPMGFDYENEINVLDGKTITLQGGGTLQLENDYRSAEAEHLTTVYSNDLNALFTSDFCYNGVHPWLGQGVDKDHIENWKYELKRLKKRYTDSNMMVFPGHGDKSDISLFDKVLNYIQEFERAIEVSESKEQAMQMMKNCYPKYEQSDFLLLHSVDYHMGLKFSNH